MPSITLDGRSFLVDGRRIWLIAGRVPYARLPRDTWADRIHAARQAGFNAIETPVVWARHEPRQGKFDFQGDNDLRYFVDLVGKAGMYCILGLGPYVGASLDMGGLPPWLSEQNGMKLRNTGGPFLEASSRFITAVADQIRGWQMTAAGSGGPIVMVQCESDWTCGNDDLAGTYLGELTRYIRESGITVPIINSNQLWAGVEGQIDGWTDAASTLEQIRQLAVVRPEQPRYVVDLLAGEPDIWGRESAPEIKPWAAMRRCAEVLAGGGQFTVRSLCAGVSFGFSAGRSPQDADSFITSASDAHALLNELGKPRGAHSAVRRIATFATRFGRVLANLDSNYRPVSLCPAPSDSLADGGKKGKGASGQPRAGVSVIYGQGSQGNVVFVFGDEPQSENTPPQTVHLLLSDGWTLPVTLPREGVAWLLFDVNISGRCKLDYCNLSPLGSVGQVLVCFGVPGSQAMLSINGSPVEVVVPEDKPAILDHEGLTVVMVSVNMADQVFFKEDGVVVRALGLTQDGTVIPMPGAKDYIFVGADGKSQVVPVESAPKGKSAGAAGEKPPAAPALSPWSCAPIDDYIDGSSARFAKINGPADLTTLGCPYGYGWYRLEIQNPSTRKARMAFPESGDRLHLFHDRKPLGIVGVAPGASPEITLPLKKGLQTVVVLAENLGRFAGGANFGESKGLYGHGYEIENAKLGTPKIMTGRPVEAVSFRPLLWEVSAGDATFPDRLTWTINHKRKTPLMVCVPKPPASALLLLNDEPIAYFDGSGPTRVMLSVEQLEKGSSLLQIALLNSMDPEEDLQLLAQTGIGLIECANPLTTEAEFSFAKWEPPSASSYEASPKNAKIGDNPCWWRCTFECDKPHGLYFEPIGMSKGQIYINGKHLCRYWVATADGKPVPPQTRYFVPQSWIMPGQNEIVLFDEHGGNPAKCRFTH
ncbi:MAG: beta-galactosidase [Phycisphaeraceae bacterium]|nr:beta-galactosidase [Phycisphaeraceae bacterium]